MLYSLIKLQRLYSEYESQFELGTLGAQASPGGSVEVGLFRFLTADLRFLTTKLYAQAREMHKTGLECERERAEKERERVELQHLRQRLRGYRESQAVEPDEAERIDRALLTGSPEEIRRMVEDLDARLLERASDAMERTFRSKAVERTTQRIQAEFEGLPPDKLENEAKDARDMYQQAQAERDARTKLRLLKEARKKIPKALRPERF